MRVVRLKEEMRKVRNVWFGDGVRVGFVPTMGALHKGHTALIERSVYECDKTVVSIFVNPIQFGPNEDYERYPRPEEEDLRICREVGVDVVFIPTVEEMYESGGGTVVEPHPDMSACMCGVKRPGHFRGVLTVVVKLFNITQPDVAYFGQKDYQQFRLIERMVKDLDFDLELVMVPTVREDNGLAVSSRNEYLSVEERKSALCLYKALKTAERMVVEDGIRNRDKIVEEMRSVVESAGGRLDYIEIVEPYTLEPVDYVDGKVVVGLAVFVGSARLIDNIILSPEEGEIDADAL